MDSLQRPLSHKRGQHLKRASGESGHVYFDFQGHIFYRASKAVSLRRGGPFKKGEFALCALSSEVFVRAVYWAG